METSDEIPLEDHRYFLARLHHLEMQHPAALLNLLERGTLTQHLREMTSRGMVAIAELTFNQSLPADQADELVMNQLIADPQEKSHLNDRTSRLKLRLLLARYEREMHDLPRTYLSQSETTE